MYSKILSGLCLAGLVASSAYAQNGASSVYNVELAKGNIVRVCAESADASENCRNVVLPIEFSNKQKPRLLPVQLFRNTDPTWYLEINQVSYLCGVRESEAQAVCVKVPFVKPAGISIDFLSGKNTGFYIREIGKIKPESGYAGRVKVAFVGAVLRSGSRLATYLAAPDTMPVEALGRGCGGAEISCDGIDGATDIPIVEVPGYPESDPMEPLPDWNGTEWYPSEGGGAAGGSEPPNAPGTSHMDPPSRKACMANAYIAWERMEKNVCEPEPNIRDRKLCQEVAMRLYNEERAYCYTLN